MHLIWKSPWECWYIHLLNKHDSVFLFFNGDMDKGSAECYETAHDLSGESRKTSREEALKMKSHIHPFTHQPITKEDFFFSFCIHEYKLGRKEFFWLWKYSHMNNCTIRKLLIPKDLYIHFFSKNQVIYLKCLTHINFKTFKSFDLRYFPLNS